MDIKWSVTKERHYYVLIRGEFNMGNNWSMPSLFYYQSFLVFIFVLIFTACGSGSGSAPSVNSTFPIAFATGIARNTTVTATFDKDVFAATVDGSSFTLENDGNVSGQVTFDGVANIATFTPISDLVKLTSYTAILTTGITDLSGNALASNYAWSFTTSDATWGSAELIETDNLGAADFPKVDFDGHGNAIAVWRQGDGGDSGIDIWANRYVEGVGWGTAELIEDSGEIVGLPEVALDDLGDAVVVWSQIRAGFLGDIYSNRYVVGTGWGNPELIEADSTGYANAPQVAIDTSGNAIAVWSLAHNGSHIWANRYVAGTGWGSAELIEAANMGNAWSPQVTVDGSGNAIVAWEQSDAFGFRIWANRYAVGTGWGSAEVIDTDNVGSSSEVQVVFDSGGNAIAVWQRTNETGIGREIWANRYVVDVGWGGAELIESDIVAVTLHPQIAVNGSGNAVVIWHQNDGVYQSIWTNYYMVGKGWGGAELMEHNMKGAGMPQVAIDGSGNAIGVWVQPDGAQDSIWANRYVVGTGWGSAELIETNDLGGVIRPEVAVEEGGNAIAVWVQNDGTRNNIWANRFE